MQKSRFVGCTVKKKRFSKFRWGEPHSEYRGILHFYRTKTRTVLQKDKVNALPPIKFDPGYSIER